MRLFTDQTGYRISLPDIPRRIVSLVPSQTELLFDLGLDENVVGITKFCVHPENWFREKYRIGGTKQVHFDRVAGLKPDLILANKEENVKEQVDVLRQLAPVWTSDISTLDEAMAMIDAIGLLTNTEAASLPLVQKIRQGFGSLLPYPEESPHPVKTVAYLIWQDPIMTVGRDTFIHEILHRANLHNVFSDQLRYPHITVSEIRKKNPDYLFLSSEPYPFREKHLQAFQQLLPDTHVKFVDGEMFSWYGSRLQYTPAYLAELLT